jgi:ABC-type antimicrobial peptide transport system permease subunit/class 3 adenylate cyclase
VDTAVLETDLQQTIDARPSVYLTRMTDFAETQDEALGLFTVALNGMLLLAVVAAALGIVNTTVMSIHERRQELGLLRAVGGTRRQIRQVVMGENALIGLVGAIFGVVAGMGSVVILVTTLGGSSWGVTDLELWPAAGRALKPTISNGIVGILAAPLISAWVARWPLRPLLRGSALATLNPERQGEMDEREPRREPARHLYSLAWRNLQEHRLRTLFSATAVALGVAMIIAAKVTSTGILDTTEGENAFAVFIDIMGTMLGIIGIAIMAAAGFLIFNAFAMTVAQRKRQIGVLRSLGMTRGQVMRQLLAEALFTGVMGTVFGSFLGPLFGNGVLAVFRQLGTDVGQGSATLGSVLLAVAMGLGITLLSVLIPARQATRISPLAALRNQETGDWKLETKSSTPRLQFLVSSLILIILWLYLAIAPPGAWTGLHSPWEYLMALLLFLPWLLGLMLLLPTLIGAAGMAVRQWARRRGANLRLVADNLTRDRRRVTLTVLTFAVGLGMISFNNGILSFTNDVLLMRATEDMRQQTSWQVFSFDRSSGVAQITEMNSNAGISTAVYDEVYRLAKDRAHVSEGYMVTVPEISSPMPGFPSFISTNLDSLASGPGQYRFVEGDWETARPILESGCGLLLPPSVAARNEVGLGDTLTLPAENGPLDCTVAGIGAGGSVPASLISAAAIEAFDLEQPTYLTVWPMPGADADALDADLRAMADRFGEDAFISTPEGELRAVIDTSDQLESMSYAMLALAVVAAALGMVNTTVMSVTERRHELGLLRAVGMTRRQATTVVVGEAALIGLLGGLLGLVAGLGLTLIFGLSYGGIPFGLVDLPLWEAAWDASPAAIVAGLAGVVIAPLVGGLAAYWPSRSALRGTAIETIDTSYQIDVRREVSGLLSRGSIRARFVAGTAVLMLLILWGLTGTITRHARNYLEDTTADTVTSLVEFNASIIEFSLPADAANLTLDSLQSSSLDADMMLEFRALMDEMDAFGLTEFVVTDQDDIVLFGFDMNQVGDVLEPPADRERTISAVVQPDSGPRQIQASTPIRNEAGDALGFVRLRLELGEIADFLRDLNRAILGVGVIILLFGLLLAWLVTTPLVRAVRQLSAQARQTGQGRFEPMAPMHGRFPRINLSLRTKLTAVMVLLLILLVGLLELVVLPIERRKVEEVTRETLIAGAEWAAELLATGMAEQSQPLSQFSDMADLLQMLQGTDLVSVQDLSDQLRNENIAYFALVNDAGLIQLADQFEMIGQETAVPTRTILQETQWQDDPVWQITAPLRQTGSSEIDGALQMAVRLDAIESFLAESRNLFNLTAIIAILAGVILAQAIGGAVVAPVRQMAADTRRVGQGDLSVQFPVHKRDELAVLAEAYNEMVAGLREREWLRDMFGRFVSQEVAEAIRTGQVKLEGENRVVSVLFCDIRNFTGRSEQSTPEEIVALLNEYLPVVVEAAQEHEGTVNKFGGDSTLIIYGAPKRLQESAYQAICTGLAMQQKLAALNQRLAERGEEAIRIGVGISTGMVLAGAVGPPERQEYTVIGDTVNLASRIEALNKVYPQHGILISGQTYDALGSRRAEFTFTDLGEIQIRGKTDAVRVWAVETGV